MRRFLPSLEESKIWVLGGIIYAWVSYYLIFGSEPTREWLFHDSPLRDYPRVIRWLSPAQWTSELTPEWAVPLLLDFVLGTLFGAALGYFLRTAVRIVFRR